MMTITPVLSVKANDTIWIGSTVSRMLNVLSVTENKDRVIIETEYSGGTRKFSFPCNSKVEKLI